MTPAETLECIRERQKHDAEMAWRIAFLSKIEGKDFPKSPDEMWATQEEKIAQQQNGLLAFAKTLKAEKDREKREGAQKKTRTKKKKPKPSGRVFMRPD